MTIPQSDPRANYLAHKEEIDLAISRVLESGSYILGQEVTALEREFASYIGVGHAIGVASGTDALEISLRACGVSPGDKVITVSFTAVATASAIRRLGAIPAFVDIDPRSLTMDTRRLSEAIRQFAPHATAILPVHLYGHPAPMQEIVRTAREHNLMVVEDCAQSHGASISGKRTGCWGNIAAFSFYPTKNLGALGDGGMVVTDDQELAERVRLLRQYGWRERYVSELAGTNSRLDELQAAILRIKLRYLDQENARRSVVAQQYTEKLKDTTLILPTIKHGMHHAFHQYVVRSSQRDTLREFLNENGIDTLVHYPRPIHLQPAYSRLRTNGGNLEESERAANEVVSLPMYPELAKEDALSVVESIRRWNDQINARSMESHVERAAAN